MSDCGSASLWKWRLTTFWARARRLLWAWWRRRDIPKTKWFLRAVAISGALAVIALECGWIVTEVGRQPWIVYQLMRTQDAVTQADGVWVTFAGAFA